MKVLGGLDIIINNGANGGSEEPDTNPGRYEEAFQLHGTHLRMRIS